MIKVKDFKVGETAYLVDYTYDNHWQKRKRLKKF